MGLPSSVSGGGYGPPAVGRGALPFKAQKPSDKNIVVVFQIVSDNPEQTQVISKKIAEQIKDLRFGDYGIVALLSPHKVEMSATDTEKIAAFILPTVLRMLQIPDYKAQEKSRA
jgi:hypothetical protein